MLPYSYGPDLDMPPPAAAPPPLMSGPPASVPGSVPQTGERRDMSPQEIGALWGEQGIQPELLPPLSLGDLAMQPVGELLNDADVAKYLVPLSMLGMVRYKRPGVSATAMEAAERYHATPRVDPIAAKNTVFHATDPKVVGGILNAGEIVPDARQLKQYGLKSWDEFRRLQPLPRYDQPVSDDLLTRATDLAREWGVDPARVSAVLEPVGREVASEDIPPGWGLFRPKPKPPVTSSSIDFQGFIRDVFGNRADEALARLGHRVPQAGLEDVRGVSVSRVPRVASKGDRAVSFVIDPEKIPQTRPFTERDYRKTLGNAPWEVDEYHKPRMNPRFEFEDRTFDEAIPASAIREMWLDKSALPMPPSANTVAFMESFLGRSPTPPATLETLRDLASQYNIPLREFETGREMHRGRAALSDLAKKKRK